MINDKGASIGNGSNMVNGLQSPLWLRDWQYAEVRWGQVTFWDLV